MEKPPNPARHTSVLFVCMGNICRSPTAEGVFRTVAQRRNVLDRFMIDSAGTHGYHIGAAPDERAIAHAAAHGYDLSKLRARQVVADDFDRFDFVLAMDGDNVRHLKSICPLRSQNKIELLLDYSHEFAGGDVPDPYYGGAKDFERALVMIENGCAGLADFLVKRSGP